MILWYIKKLKIYNESENVLGTYVQYLYNACLEMQEKNVLDVKPLFSVDGRHMMT